MIRVCATAELPAGTVTGVQVGARSDLRTGRPTGLPATEPVPVCPVEIRDGGVYLDIDNGECQ